MQLIDLGFVFLIVVKNRLQKVYCLNHFEGYSTVVTVCTLLGNRSLELENLKPYTIEQLSFVLSSQPLVRTVLLSVSKSLLL